MCMEVILLALLICLILALKPVREDTHESRKLDPPSISRTIEEKAAPERFTYQFPNLNPQAEDILEINSQEIAAQKQSITRVKIETFQYEGKTYLAIQQQGVLIVREDS